MTTCSSADVCLRAPWCRMCSRDPKPVVDRAFMCYDRQTAGEGTAGRHDPALVWPIVAPEPQQMELFEGD